MLRLSGAWRTSRWRPPPPRKSSRSCRSWAPRPPTVRAARAACLPQCGVQQCRADCSAGVPALGLLCHLCTAAWDVILYSVQTPLLQLQQPASHRTTSPNRPRPAAPWVLPTTLLLSYAGAHAFTLSSALGLLGSPAAAGLAPLSAAGIAIVATIAAGLVYENVILASGVLYGLQRLAFVQCTWTASSHRLGFTVLNQPHYFPTHPPTATRPLHHQRREGQPGAAGCPERPPLPLPLGRPPAGRHRPGPGPAPGRGLGQQRLAGGRCAGCLPPDSRNAQISQCAACYLLLMLLCWKGRLCPRGCFCPADVTGGLFVLQVWQRR